MASPRRLLRVPLVENQGPSSPSQRAKSYLDAIVESNKAPGIQLFVFEPAGIILEYARGWADIQGRIVLDNATTMMAYSMSKTITAAAVLQLVENGLIRL